MSKPEVRVPTGFVWIQGRYGTAICQLNGLNVGESYWTVTRNDPLPVKGRMTLGIPRDFEAETQDRIRVKVETAVKLRIARLQAGIEASK